MSAMVMVVVQGYEKGRDGELYALAPIQARDEAHGRDVARALNCSGVAVFSRSGDAQLGVWTAAIVIMTIGHVPEALEKQRIAMF